MEEAAGSGEACPKPQLKGDRPLRSLRDQEPGMPSRAQELAGHSQLSSKPTSATSWLGDFG